MRCGSRSSITAALVALAGLSSHGKKIERLSFEQPFDLIDSEGVRQVSAEYAKGGDAVVAQHFARLTTDRQSKSGFLWFKGGTMEMDDFSLIFTFRISGSGSRLFGDGIALWLTDKNSHVAGDNHGFAEYFTGIGIIFDTFVNPERASSHKDVTLVLNDGTKSMPLQRQLKGVSGTLGCTSKNIRYLVNDGFNAAVMASRAKVSYSSATGQLKVWVDATNTGEWMSCWEGNVAASLVSGRSKGTWPRDATLGITATTGSLADNHDIISLSVFDEVEDKQHALKDEGVKEKAVIVDDVHAEDSMTNEDKITHLYKELKNMIENAEFKFTALKEQTANTIEKLKIQEEKDEVRIAELQAMVDGRVDSTMDSQLNVFQKNFDEKLETHMAEGTKHTRGWMTPFFILVCVLCVVGFFSYKKYLELKKSHLL